MQALADATGTEVALAVRTHLVMFYAEHCHSTLAPRSASGLGLGMRLPLGTSAAGRAWMAAQDEDTRRDLTAQIASRRPADARRIEDDMAQALQDYRTLGVACSFGAWRLSVNAIARAFSPGPGLPLLVINCGGPAIGLVFSGRILEIEGLPNLKAEQAFELSDASAERSAAGCTVRLNKEPIIEYIHSNIVLLKNMIAEGYEDARTIRRRIQAMEAWLANPQLLAPDADAEYAAVIEIDLAEITEPIVCCPNDPDDAKTLSDVAGAKIDEVFIGSCMTNIGHFRAASKLLEGKKDMPVKLWMAPPTKMDAKQLTEEGHYGVFGAAGARMEMPGCSLCMGNQAQVKEGATVMSTSTRNFPNRLGKNTNVYLGSAELSAIASKIGRIPTKAEYLADMGVIKQSSDQIYQYLNFDQIEEYVENAKEATA